MSRTTTLFIAGLASLLLAACAHQPAQIQYQTQVIAPADDLIRNCAIAPPPDRNTYLATKTWEDREALLVNNIHYHLTNEQLCNVRMEQLRSWKAQQLKIYNSTPKGP